jgi:GNAT superfamily N-acetyltransferase
MPGNMDSLIRGALVTDAESIAAVHIRSWQTAYRGLLPDSFLDGLDRELDQRAAFWRREISVPRTKTTEVWVTETKSQLNGFAAFGPARGSDSIAIGELYAIYLDPQCWGQGLGRKLLAHATRRLLSHGYSIAILWVLESNRRARRFYEIAGWTLDGDTKLENIPDGIELREVSYQISFSREEEE